ncbi:Thiol-disulfide isomerase or thioredoxin [Devosia enhydra]|uniref:Thiol-disulfide isomerase or thioredoxin n=1 Tax=Devosia enhydra TaxID=665118 RepID=A0A1K2I0K2_9HYPH|nr:TlpA disulfide reductase family protein [Devosia enhydra]SFZ85731.1 Thiol-disulfide isomerase or thioredoxin [Devosia enhydra]
MTEPAPQKPAGSRNRRLALVALSGAGLALAAGLWLSNAGSPNAAQCPAMAEAATRIDAASTGELAALQATGFGRGFADLAFTDAEGKPVSIADFAGKGLLVNFWASWCVPCREEMPALEALAARHNGADFMVLPINLDIGADGGEKARAFLEEGNWPNLPLYADATFRAFDRLKTEGVAIGLPATLLLDTEGCELAVLQGPAHWDSPDGDRVVEALKAEL